MNQSDRSKKESYVHKDLAGKYNIEWYSGAGNMQDADYQSAIWIPVKKK